MTVALQVITGVHVGSDGGFVSGRVARATPVAGQFIDHSTVDSTVLTSPISGSDGTWSLTLICGVVYDIKIDRWAVQTIRVTDDATLDFSWYLEQSLELVNGATQIPSSLTPAMVTALDGKLSRPDFAPAGKQLTFDAEGDVVASSYDVGAAGGGGLASADDLALALYSLGMLVVVAGPQIEGTDPPQMAPSTAAQVAHLIAIGIPEAYIGWSVTGSEAAAVSTSGTFDLPSISLTPTIVAPSLNGLQGGGFSIPQVSLQPVISAPALSGVQQGSFTLPAVSLQPAVTAPQLDGVQAGVGSFTLPSVSLRPVVAVSTLAGVQVGSFATPSVSLQPTVTAPPLTGVQVGSISLPSVSLRPVVAAPTLTGASTGSITPPAVTLQPVVAAPSLTASTGGGATITENFDTAIATTYSINPTYPSNMAATATVQGWTIGSSGTDPATYDVYDSFYGAYIRTTTGGFAGNCLSVAGCHTEDSEANIMGESGFKASKTWTGPFASGTLSIKYKTTGGATKTIKVNGVSVGVLTQDNVWNTASIALTSPANITVELECAPSSNVPSSIAVDNIAYS